MKRILLFCLSLILVAGYSDAQNKKKKAEEAAPEWNYEIETLSKNSRGDYILKVWNFSNKPVVTMEQGKKNAVHSMIFKGALPSKDDRVPGIKALVSAFGAEEEHAAFFKEFFADGGDYKKFVSLSNNGFAEVVKIPPIKNKVEKKTTVYKFKIGQTVTVNVPALRKYLEEAGIVKSLTAGFN